MYLTFDRSTYNQFQNLHTIVKITATFPVTSAECDQGTPTHKNRLLFYNWRGMAEWTFVASHSQKHWHYTLKEWEEMGGGGGLVNQTMYFTIIACIVNTVHYCNRWIDAVRGSTGRPLYGKST